MLGRATCAISQLQPLSAKTELFCYNSSRLLAGSRWNKIAGQRSDTI
jgi:hypothetical protein